MRQQGRIPYRKVVVMAEGISDDHVAKAYEAALEKVVSHAGTHDEYGAEILLANATALIALRGEMDVRNLTKKRPLVRDL